MKYVRGYSVFVIPTAKDGYCLLSSVINALKFLDYSEYKDTTLESVINNIRGVCDNVYVACEYGSYANFGVEPKDVESVWAKLKPVFGTIHYAICYLSLPLIF